MEIWQTKNSKKLNTSLKSFNDSFYLDKNLYLEDITVTIAHVSMLAKQKLITLTDKNKIISSLKQILQDLESQKLKFDDSEDIHSFIEKQLTKRIGNSGKNIHIARSRNDLVVTDLKLYLKKELENITKLLERSIVKLVILSKDHQNTFLPSYTHLQQAQVTFLGHYFLAYCQMFIRDHQRLIETYHRLNKNPLGSCALNGTSLNIDQLETTKLLNFESPCENSIDAVSDRDFVCDFCYSSSMIITHLSRFCEDMIIWNSKEFSFISLDDEFATGSSIMPQKKNPDVFELIRSKTGKLNGNLVSILTILKGLPLSYNKDLQEDKEITFETVKTIKSCLEIFSQSLDHIKINDIEMLKSYQNSSVNATDCVDYLVKKKVPFRDAYQIVKELIEIANKRCSQLHELALYDFQKLSDKFERDIFDNLINENTVYKKKNYNGPMSIDRQIKNIMGYLNDDFFKKEKK